MPVLAERNNAITSSPMPSQDKKSTMQISQPNSGSNEQIPLFLVSLWGRHSKIIARNALHSISVSKCSGLHLSHTFCIALLDKTLCSHSRSLAPMCTNGYVHCMGELPTECYVKLQWASIPFRGGSNSPSHYMLQNPQRTNTQFDFNIRLLTTCASHICVVLISIMVKIQF